MLKLARHCCAVLCLVALHGLAWGGPIWVVVPNDSPIQTLTKQELADIYLDRNVVRSSLKAMPFDRAEDALRERFYLAIGISPSFMRSHWAKRVFTGRGRPPPMATASGLTEALGQGKTTLIYVEGAERPSNTRVVATLD